MEESEEEDKKKEQASEAVGTFKVAEQLRELSVAAEGAAGEGEKAAPQPECCPIEVPSAPQGLPESAGASVDGGGPALEGAAMEEGAPPLGKGPSSPHCEETERKVGLGDGAEPVPGPEGEAGSLAPGSRSPSQPHLDVNGGSDREGKEATVMEISGSSSSESERTVGGAVGTFKVAEQLRELSVAAEGAAGEGEKAAPQPECGPIEMPSAPQGLPESVGASVDGGGPALEGAAMEEGAPLLGKSPSSPHWEETERKVSLGDGAEPVLGPEGEAGSLAPGSRNPSQPHLEVNGKSDREGKEVTVMEISGSSSSESESDTDSDSSSSDSSSSCLPMLSEDDDEQNKNEKDTCSTTKGELPKQESLCIEDLKIILPESVELLLFGKVSSIIGHLVIVESQKGMPPVNEDTVLFRGDRHSIGKIFEVFGPVSHPFYVLQFNNPEHIEAKGIKIHDAVYFAPSVESVTQYIFPEKLKQDKGSDASWKNDEEPPPEVLEFSDDEKERTVKQQKKSQNLRRKKFKSQQDYDMGVMDYQPRQHYHSDYSDRREPHSTFSRGRYPHPPASPRFFRHQGRTPQQHPSSYAEPWKPSVFQQQQRPDNSRRHQYSFPPPSFEPEANFAPSPQPATWGWPPGYTQNTYDPWLSLLSLPPPPPPPLPPPSAPFNSMNPP